MMNQAKSERGRQNGAQRAPAPPVYHNVYYPDGSLAFRIDPTRLVLEIRKRGETHYFDLAALCAAPVDKERFIR